MKKKPLFAVIGGSGLYDLNGINKSKLINPSTPYGKPSDKILMAKYKGPLQTSHQTPTV